MRQTITPEDQARIAARYPRRSPVDVAVFVAATLALLGAVALVVVSGISRANPPIAAMVRSFEVQTPELTTADIVVQRTDPSQAATCSLYAQAQNYEKVGELTFEVPAGQKQLENVAVEIRTLREATSVTIDSCHLHQ